MKNVGAGIVVTVAGLEISPYVGVEFNVLVAVGIGTYCAFAIAKDKIEPRRRMWGYALACILMGAAFTAITQAIIMQSSALQMTDPLEAGVGATVSFCTRFFLPLLADTIQSGKWIDYIPFLRKKD